MRNRPTISINHDDRVSNAGYRRVGRTVLAMLFLTIVTASVGYTFQSTAVSAQNQRRYPYPGELVAVGDHQLHLYCTGSGSPTVVIEAGSGSWSLQWSVVQSQLAEFTRVCTYDRAGYGWSEPGPTPRTGEQVVSELHTALQTSGVDGPYVLVGHSLGGLFARLYAATYPDEVVGLVLVDALHEEAPERMPEPVVQVEEAKLELYEPAVFVAQWGLLHRTAPAVARVPAGLPQELHSVYDAYAYRAELFEAIASEGESLDETVKQVEAAGSLGDLPVVVIRHGRSTMFSYLLADEEQQVENVWRKLQKDLTKLSSNSRLVVAENSGHNVHLDQPVLVTEVVHRMVQDVQQKQFVATGGARP